MVMTAEEMLRTLGFEKWSTYISDIFAEEEALKIMLERVAKGVYLLKRSGIVEVWYVPRL